MRAVTALILTAVSVGAALCLLPLTGRERTLTPRAATANNPNSLQGGSTAKTGVLPNYPFSVVPGGIHSVTEFRSKPDLIARRHYGAMQAVQVEPNSAERWLYVSYRVGDRVFWSRRPARIPAGELLVSLAGSPHIRWARTRCGNLLSDVPQTPQLEAVSEGPITASIDDPGANSAPLSQSARVPAALDPALSPPTDEAATVTPGNKPAALLASSSPAIELGNSSPGVSAFSAPAGSESAIGDPAGGGMASKANSGSGAGTTQPPFPVHKPIPAVHPEFPSPVIIPKPTPIEPMLPTPEPASAMLVLSAAFLLFIRGFSALRPR